jgi:hypothetical protein
MSTTKQPATIELTKAQESLFQHYQIEMQKLELQSKAAQALAEQKSADYRLWMNCLIEDAGCPQGQYDVQVTSQGRIQLVEKLKASEAKE